MNNNSQLLQKIIITTGVFLLLILVKCIPAMAQEDSVDVHDTIHSIPHKGLYRWSGSPPWNQQENSVGLVPSTAVGRGWFAGIGVARGIFTSGEGVFSGYGATLACEFDPFNRIIAPKIDIWLTGFAFCIGGNIGLNGIVYFKEKKASFAIRPEAGFGFYKFRINYGYNFFINTKPDDFGHHAISLSYYITILPPA